MTSKELRARARQEGPKRYYAKKVRKAITYLYGTPIEKATLTASVAILKVLYVGTKRGWLYPEEIAKLVKLTQELPAVKKVGVGK
jgi:hypothetical protein